MVEGIVGLEEVLKKIKIIAPEDMPVLITGETGTGKTLIAQEIYRNSTRKDKGLITVDCGNIPPDLACAELFGHVKGAFTGADSERCGYFEAANGQTIFLDEIGNTSLAVQASLLRVIETGRYRRVGSVEEKSVDVRIIAATNSNLQEMVGKGTFRQDLYYRLANEQIRLPALRDDPALVKTLIRYFFTMHLNEINPNLKYMGASSVITPGHNQVYLHPDAEKALLCYSWPGNAREMSSKIKHAVVYANLRNSDSGLIRRNHLPELNGAYAPCGFGSTGWYSQLYDFMQTSGTTLEVLERKLIETASGHKRMEVAKVLGMGVRTLGLKSSQLKSES